MKSEETRLVIPKDYIKDLFAKQGEINRRYEKMFGDQINLNDIILKNQNQLLECQKAINDELFKEIDAINERIEYLREKLGEVK